MHIQKKGQIGGGQPYAKEKAEIKGWQKGGELFAGHTIAWGKLGNTGFTGMFERIVNYCRSCLDSNYAKAVREEFWEHMKQEVKLKAGGSKFDKIASIEKVLENIMKLSDLTNGQKMELVQLAVGNDPNIRGDVIIEGITPHGMSPTHKKTVLGQLAKSSEYFKQELKTSLDAINNTALSTIGNKSDYEASIEWLKSKQLGKHESIRTHEDLKNLTKEYAEDVLKAVAKIHEGKKDINSLAQLEGKVGDLLDKDSSIKFSSEEKKELLKIVSEAKERLERESKPDSAAMDAIDRLMRDTFKKSEGVDDVLKTIRQEFKEEKEGGTTKDYAERVISKMVNACNGKLEILAGVEKNVPRLLALEKAIVLHEDDKVALLNLVRIPRMQAEYVRDINQISQGLITKEVELGLLKKSSEKSETRNQQMREALGKKEAEVKEVRVKLEKEGQELRKKDAELTFKAFGPLNPQEKEELKKERIELQKTIKEFDKKLQETPAKLTDDEKVQFMEDWNRDNPNPIESIHLEITKNFANAKEEVKSLGDLNKRKMGYIDALIKDLKANLPKTDILRVNVEKVINDPALNFSEEQKAEIMKLV